MKLSAFAILCSIVILSTPTCALEKLPPTAAEEIRESLRRLDAVASLKSAEFVNQAWLTELHAQHLKAITAVLDRNGITYPTPQTSVGLSLIKAALPVPVAAPLVRVVVSDEREFEGT